MPITRTAMIDDDGSGTTGTIINNAWKQEFYGQIDSFAGPLVTTLTASGTAVLPTGPAHHLLVLDSAADASCHGASPASGTFATGTRLDIVNVNTGTVVLVSLSSQVTTGKFLNFVNSQYATQVHGAGQATGGTVSYIWQAGYWRLVAHEQNGAISLGFTNSNFTGFTVSQFYLQDFYVHGRDVHIRLNYEIVVAAPVAALQISNLPWTLGPSGGQVLAVLTTGTPGHPSGWGLDLAATAPTTISFYLAAGGSWPAGTYNLSLDMTVPIT
jgi:hypothetical protein